MKFFVNHVAFVIGVLCFTMPGTSFAEPATIKADALVAPALEAAFQGDLGKAASLLEQKLLAAPTDSLILWNLAAVRTRQERMGDALHAVLQILAIEAPPDIESRARNLRSQIVTRLFEKARRTGNPDVFSIRDPRSLSERWVMTLTPDTWRWIFYGSFWLVIVLLIVRRRRRPLLQTAHATLLVIGIVGSIVCGASDWAARHWIRPSQVGVVRSDQALLRHSLVKGARVDPIPEGVVLFVVEELPSDLAVRLPDGREGYMAKKDLGIVR